MNQIENRSAIHEIFKWSSSLPGWAQDALRRIVINGDCTNKDIQNVFHIAIHGVPGFSLPSHSQKAVPLSSEHIPPSPGDEQSVNLLSIGNLQSVNRLPSDQTIPLGGYSGIFIIYGNNGSGKSGYARVLKKACRARGSAQDIQPNAFNTGKDGPAKACIKYSIGGIEKSCDWIDKLDSDYNLSNVFVFDTLAAENYLTRDDSASFTPFGLDILPKLVSVYDQIRDMIAEEIESIETKNDDIISKWSYSEETEVGKFILKLSHSTDRKKLEKLAVFPEDKKRRKSEIEHALKSDPQKLIGQTEASIKRLEDYSRNIEDIFNLINSDKVKLIRKAIVEYNDSFDKNKLTSENKYRLAKLKGVGSKEWKYFWDKATEYSQKKAYPEHKFPYVNNKALCLLCQHPINEDTRARLLSFHADINDSTQKDLNNKLAILEQYEEEYNNHSDINSELEKIEADLKYYLDDEQYASIKVGIIKVAERFNLIKRSIADKDYKEKSLPDVTFLDLIKDAIVKFKGKLRIEKSASNPEERTKYENELDELKDNEWLSKHHDRIIDYLDNLRKIYHLEAKKSETKTKNVSDYTTQLTNTFVTEKFCRSFQSELIKLGLKSIKVEMEKKRSKKAVTEFGLKVINAEDWKIKEIASEGEQRCIALACYLTELSQSSHNSALVFDDPVSSLDHYFRSRIAFRLAEESLNRQIIVFTHDMAFLNDLQTASEQLRSNIQTGYLEWSGENPGCYFDGLPWDCMRPEQRLDDLQKIFGALSKKIAPYPTVDTILEIRNAYSKLSATLERIVESVIFNDVIGRFRGHVKMGNLRKAIGFTVEEHDEIMCISKNCGDTTERHDPAIPYQTSVPSIEQLGRDIEKTREILVNIRNRQKTAEKQ